MVATLGYLAQAGALRPSPAARMAWLAAALWSAAAVAIALTIYAAGGFWLAPRLIEAQVVGQISERYHRRASVGQVRFNPFTFRLQADGFSLPDANGEAMIGFDRLTVRPSIASMWRGGLTFSEIALEAPRIRLVRRPNGRLNIQDLAAASDEPKPPPRLFIDNLSVRGGGAEVVDLAGPRPVAQRFAPVDFTLRDFSTVKQGGAYVLKATSERDEGLAWRGTFSLDPLVSHGAFALSTIRVAPIAELAGAALPFRVTGGEADVSGTYRFALEGKATSLQVDVAELRLTRAGLRAEGADIDWITLPEVTVSKARIDVPARTLSVDRMAAIRPIINAWTEGNSLNLSRYARARSVPQADAAPAPPWRASVGELRVRGAKVSFEERSRRPPMRIKAAPLDVTLTGLTLPARAPVQVEAIASLDGGGRLTAKGVVRLDQPLTAEFDVAAFEVELPRFQPIVARRADLQVLSGRASATGRLSYGGNGQARFDGTARVDALHTVDGVLREDFLDCRTLRAEGLSVRTRPLSVKVREIAAQEPYARVVIGPDQALNVDTVLHPRAAGPRPRTPAQGAALPVEVALVTVARGRLEFADLSLTPGFVAGVQHLNGTIRGLSSRGEARATMNLDGQVDGHAPVKIEGEVASLGARSHTDVRMTFRNVEMARLSPYSARFAGYRISSGKLNVDVHYNIDDHRLTGAHEVAINQLQLGERVASPEAVQLPVKLVVALMKDRSGMIEAPIEISGDLDDPRFRMWPAIWKAVRDRMAKTAASPFRVLGAVAGGGGQDLQHIDFAPGSGKLNTAGRRKLATVAKALEQRPAINVEVPMPVNSALDGPALARAELDARLAAAAAKRLGPKARKPGAVAAALAEPRTRRAVLEDAYRAEFGARPAIPRPGAGARATRRASNAAAVSWMEKKLAGRIVVSDAELKQLGRERARAVQTALLGQGRLNPSRVSVTARTPAPTGASGVRMTLSLS